MRQSHWTPSTIDGRQVRVVLRDGSRLDDCQLVSRGLSSVETLWLCADGEDLFVPVDDVIELWPLGGGRPEDAA